MLLENFSPGTMDELGVGYEVLKQINPRLIYATGSGFGITGPDRDNLAMDFTIQAQSGIMSVTGFPDGPPMKAGPTLVDFMGGIHLYAAVITALFQRERTGRGPAGRSGDAGGGVFVARLQHGVPCAHREGAAAHRQPPVGLASAPYNAYPDRRWLGRDPRGHRGALEEPGDRRWAARNWRTIRALPTTPRAPPIWRRPTMSWLQWTQTLGKMEVFAIAKRYRIPCAPVRTVPEVMNDPHMHGRGMLERIDHPELGNIVVPTTPLRLHGAEKVPTTPSPIIGQHNEEIYGGWLGLSADEILALKQQNII